MTNTIARLQTLIRLAEMQTDKLPIVALHDEDIQALKRANEVMIMNDQELGACVPTEAK